MTVGPDIASSRSFHSMKNRGGGFQHLNQPLKRRGQSLADSMAEPFEAYSDMSQLGVGIAVKLFWL